MVVEWEPPGGVYVVTVPELPGCRTHGTTYEEAIRQGQEAIEGWIDANRAWGHPIPPPRFFDLGEEGRDSAPVSETATATATAAGASFGT
jgi:predicted RNase H-like HicB family nuclease